MSYIYTVKPLKEAIKIAIEAEHFAVSADGKVKIYGIDGENWPAGESVVRSERIKKENRSIVVGLFFIPPRYLDETEEPETPVVPEFITNLYNAVTASCGTLRCDDCPLNHLMGGCESIGDFIHKKWGLE